MIVSHDLVRPPTVGQMVHLKLTQICLDDVGVIVITVIILHSRCIFDSCLRLIGHRAPIERHAF